MLRKVTLGLVAAAAVATAALAPTSASAFGGHGWHGGGFHGGWHGGGFRHWGGPRFVGAYAYGGGCMVRRLVATPWGYRYRLVNRCY